MPERPDDQDQETTGEIRTSRLVIVGEDGTELAVLAADRGVVELRLGARSSGLPCSATIYAGQPEPGVYTAGVELWANGNSVWGVNLSAVGDRVETHSFCDTIPPAAT